jgi:hypothetical protein
MECTAVVVENTGFFLIQVVFQAGNLYINEAELVQINSKLVSKLDYYRLMQ